jgi:3-oxoadipate enol-lactonase
MGELPTLVLLHAFPLDREMWRPQVTALGDVAKVITLDLPGFGAAPVEPGWSVDSAADYIAAATHGPIVVGGLSMGGYVAMAFARRHPDRLAGLILADTRSEPDDAPGKQNRDRLISLTREFGPSKVYEAMIPKVLCDETRERRPNVLHEVRRIAAQQTAEGVIGGLIALRDRPDATPELAKIAVPTLIIVGEDDAVTPPPLAEAMARHIRGSKVVTIPGAGHLSNLETPDDFNFAVRAFLTTTIHGDVG